MRRMPGPTPFITFPIEQPPSSSDTTSSDGDGVGKELTQKGTIRQKRFATRGRTGCLTCRARHVRCDEERPACRRCIRGRRECRGYELDNTAAIPITFHNFPQSNGDGETMHRRELLQQHVVAGGRCLEPEPPDWEVMEAARYYLHFVTRYRQEQQMTSYEALPPCHGPNRPIFLLDVSSHRIAAAYKSSGRQSKGVSHSSSVEGAWVIHSRQMMHVLGSINAGIRDERAAGGKSGVLRRIFTLLQFDLIVDASVWRPHLLGYLAVVEHMGGVSVLMRQNDAYLDHTQSLILIVALTTNATSPANNQLWGFEAYTNDDVTRLVATYSRIVFPFPSLLMVAIKTVTQLRTRVASNAYTKTDLQLMVCHLFDDIGAFDAQNWAKTLNSDVEAVSGSFARILQAAVLLYGILSLPCSAVAGWAVASGQWASSGRSMYDSVRVSHRRKLLDLLYPHRGTFGNLLALNWPLVVAGASLAGDGSTEDRDFITESLLDIWKNPLSKCGPILCLEKLRTFWASGKTVWDDCFDEPTPSLA
ncbi:hypothetical protein PWT90_06291 [Aphanocladium album]|nr:hypothetical protein PWT90_06291 [Aphanocladium album]